MKFILGLGLFVLLHFKGVDGNCWGLDCPKCILSGCWYIKQKDGSHACIGKLEIGKFHVVSFSKTVGKCGVFGPSTKRPIVAHPIASTTTAISEDRQRHPTMRASSTSEPLVLVDYGKFFPYPLITTTSTADLPSIPTKLKPVVVENHKPTNYGTFATHTVSTPFPNFPLPTPDSNQAAVVDVSNTFPFKATNGDNAKWDVDHMKGTKSSHNITTTLPSTTEPITNTDPIITRPMNVPSMPNLSPIRKLELIETFKCNGFSETLAEKIDRSYCRTASLEEKQVVEKRINTFNPMRAKLEYCFLLNLKYRNCIKVAQ